MRTRHFLAAWLCISLAGSVAWAQQSSQSAPEAAQSATNADFLRAADEVMADMSKLLSLPVREPLKKSVRSKEEIRDYLIRNMKEDEDSAKRHADVRTLEALGLLPKDYPLEQKLIELLTDQIAGVYDPKGREFFIAASVEPAEQRVVMAHELTHALQDQSFHIEPWSKAVKDNDDAGFARDAVLEGSAMVAMIDYLLRDSGTSFRDLGNFDPSLLMGDVGGSPELNDVPLVLKDQLLFPYLAGAAFSAKVLATAGGWSGLHILFERPPASTQQIMHPDLYLRGVQPEAVQLPPMGGVVPRGWKKLDENIMGEFGFHQVFKQFLGNERADDLAATWSGDRYAIYEQSPEGRALMLIRVRLAGESEAARFFAGYSELLDKRHTTRTSVAKEPSAYFFDTPDGGAFIRCAGRECLLAEGATRAQFDALGHAMGWPAVPAGVAANAKGREVELVSTTYTRVPAAAFLPVESSESLSSRPSAR
jgi:hypothetical protein